MSITIRSLLAGAALLFIAPTVYAEEVTLRLAHVLSPSEPMHLAAERYAEIVAERSDGRISISVFPSGQLGGNPDLYEQVRMGVPVIQISDPGYLSDFVADFGVLNGPYLLDDPADFQKLIESDWYAGIVEQIAEEHRIRVLSLNWLFGSRHIIANQPVRTLDDMENLAIRVPPNVMWIETFRALGARGTTLDWPEVYSGLANRVIDAAEAPLSSLYGSRLYESADTISMTSHFIAFTGPIINEDLFQSMPTDLREILTEAAVEAGLYMADLVNEGQATFRASLEAQGTTFVDDVDTAAFREATASVYDAFPEWSEGLHDRIRALLDD